MIIIKLLILNCCISKVGKTALLSFISVFYNLRFFIARKDEVFYYKCYFLKINNGIPFNKEIQRVYVIFFYLRRCFEYKKLKISFFTIAVTFSVGLDSDIKKTTQDEWLMNLFCPVDF